MVNYQIIRSDRRSVAIQISGAGEVTVRCPKRMPQWKVARFVETKRDWIEKHLRKLAHRPEVIPLTEAEVTNLKKQARPLLQQRVAALAPIVGVSYGRIAIRAQHGRWGSCSSKGNLNFNCLLARVPQKVLDYVVVHELCHLKHPNHSASFWAEVRRVIPDYMEAEKWLKENGSALIASLPK